MVACAVHVAQATRELACMPLRHFDYKLKCINFSAELRSSGSIAVIKMQSNDPTALLLAILIHVKAQEYFNLKIDKDQQPCPCYIGTILKIVK